MKKKIVSYVIEISATNKVKKATDLFQNQLYKMFESPPANFTFRTQNYFFFTYREKNVYKMNKSMVYSFF